MNSAISQVLPYTDSKPVGAAGFYTAINATFRFIMDRLGREGLLRYWQDLGSRYYRPVSDRWKAGGTQAIAAHWRAFFDAEPGARAEVEETTRAVIVEVRACPMIQHLREHGREIVPCFCQHCYYVSEAIARPAGFTVRITGGNGTCTQTYLAASAASTPQDLDQIHSCVSPS